VNKRIMVVMAHADDMEYYAGGTMAKFVDRGYEGGLVMLTVNWAGADIDGDGGYRRHPPEKVIPVRDAEMRAGAEVLGVSVIEQLNFKNLLYSVDGEFVWFGDTKYDVHHPLGEESIAAAAINSRCIRRVQAILEEYEPEIVIAHNFSSGFEHTCAAHVVNQAFGQAVKAGADVGSLWVPAHVRHCAWQSDVRLFPSPSVIVDISDYWQKKVDAMRAHRSQNVERTLEKVEIICRYWGIARQCRYAEPFFTVNDARYA
jgi:LmbE family N-acetylglucosaminyl deacetylase